MQSQPRSGVVIEGNPAERFFEFLDADPAEGRFFWTGGPVEVAERTWFQSQGSGVTAFDTDEGLVLVDAGTVFFGEVLAERVRARTRTPLHTVIYTHGHIDHAFSTSNFLLPGRARPRVVGHENMAERFARYEVTARHNHVINTRQFGGSPEDADMASPEAVGTDALIARARELHDAGHQPVAGALPDLALEAEPENEAVQTSVAQLYDRRADAEPGLMATNLYRSVAAYARAGRPFR